jgi:hypothetical protein
LKLTAIGSVRRTLAAASPEAGRGRDARPGAADDVPDREPLAAKGGHRRLGFGAAPPSFVSRPLGRGGRYRIDRPRPERASRLAPVPPDGR